MTQYEKNAIWKAVFIAIFAMVTLASALDNGVARTPPMGWNPWNAFHSNFTEEMFKEILDSVVSMGFGDAGYVYMNMEGTANRVSTFPSGLGWLADYVHGRQFKLGIYAGNGVVQKIDIDTVVSRIQAFGVNYLKYDSYNIPSSEQNWRQMRDGILALGQPVVYNIHYNDEKTTLPDINGLCHSWRITNDIVDYYNHESIPPDSQSWAFSTMDVIDRMAEVTHTIKPGCWADPDMLQVGNGKQTLDEYRTQFSMWCLLPAPLIMGHDVRKTTAEIKNILLNTELIAINQDTVGIPALRLRINNGHEVWARGVSGGSFAVAMLNRNQTAAEISFTWGEIGAVETDSALVRDLWQHKDMGTFVGSYAAEVPAHGAVVVKITPKSALALVGFPGIRGSGDNFSPRPGFFNVRGQYISNVQPCRSAFIRLELPPVPGPARCRLEGFSPSQP